MTKCITLSYYSIQHQQEQTEDYISRVKIDYWKDINVLKPLLEFSQSGSQIDKNCRLSRHVVWFETIGWHGYYYYYFYYYNKVHPSRFRRRSTDGLWRTWRKVRRSHPRSVLCNSKITVRCSILLTSVIMIETTVRERKYRSQERMRTIVSCQICSWYDKSGVFTIVFVVDVGGVMKS